MTEEDELWAELERADARFNRSEERAADLRKIVIVKDARIKELEARNASLTKALGDYAQPDGYDRYQGLKDRVAELEALLRETQGGARNQ